MDRNTNIVLPTPKTKWEFANIERKVAKKLEDTQNYVLPKRKERLKQFLLDESSKLNRELMEQELELSKKYLEERLNKAKQIAANEELNKRREAAEKLEQLLRENSEEERKWNTIEKQLEAVATVKYQIEEKLFLATMEKKINEIWEKVMGQYYDNQNEAEMKRKKESEALKQKYCRELLQQMDDKIQEMKKERYASIQEGINYEALAKEYNEEIRQGIEKERLRMQDLAKERKNELHLSREIKRLKKLDEYHYNKLCSEIIPCIGEMRDEAREKRNAKMELDLYNSEMEKLKRLRENEARHELEIRNREETTIAENLRKLELQEAAKRNKAQKDIMQIRMHQIIMKGRMAKKNE